MRKLPRTDCPAARRSSLGASLPELVIVLGLMAIVSGGAWRTLTELRETRASREAARGLAADMRGVAQQARGQRRCLAVEFDLRVPERWRVLADGNGNGVTTADISAGIDAPQTPWMRVFREGRARLAVARDVPRADGTGTLVSGSSPIQIGVSPRLVFTPRGTGAAGSIYVAGRGQRAYAIRVLGTTQRIRLSCLAASGAWETC
jgi:type II secretory pathway pseudopilin PulG